MSKPCKPLSCAGLEDAAKKDAGIHWKILIIDDEQDVREVMALSLEDAGYQTICVPDGAAGLKALTRHSPQILITDIKMPGMSGLDVLEKAKQIRPETQVIITTGFADIKKAVTALQHDASDFITKPVDDATLHMALKRAMQRYRDRQELADYTRLLEQTVLNQEKILHQEKMMSLGRLAASMVHEINNPLSGILNYIRLMIRLADQPDWDPSKKKRFSSYLAIIEKETQRCSDLVSGLLQFSRKSQLASVPVDICELIDYSLLLCSHKLQLSNIHLEKSCASMTPRVLGDFNQLQQCLINLIFNAIDALDTGGGVADMPGPAAGNTAADADAVPGSRPGSETSVRISGRIQVEGYFDPAEELVHIRVADNGKGISSTDLPYIFEPFFTTKKDGHGVGLGLSTVYGIIEHHKGTITVESEPGQRTCFTIKLPPADGDSGVNETNNTNIIQRKDHG
ncbi:MAG: hybrid sensor histidine kinase/response regulator [Desulfotignum sp.]|jgi:signal transduction histidine kinase|nr:hybrid sensor histidine kinase/response regulator [Desulfotignum sp.]